MERMGHDSERATLIYLHSSAELQRGLADVVGDAARAELDRSKKRKMASHLARERREVVGRTVLISESAGEWEWRVSLSGRETPWMTARSGT